MTNTKSVPAQTAITNTKTTNQLRQQLGIITKEPTHTLDSVRNKMRGLQEYSSLCEASPIPQGQLDKISSWNYLGQLFPGDPLLSIGGNYTRFHTRYTAEHQHQESTACLGQIVPAAMTARTGLTAKNVPERGIVPKISPRCNANTGPLYYVVYRNSTIDLDEQARGIIRVAATYRLAMVVHATPEVIEAWFPCGGWSHRQIKILQDVAAKYGSRSKNHISCQPFAVPGGRTYHERRETFGPVQRVVYFDPAALGQQTQETQETQAA